MKKQAFGKKLSLATETVHVLAPSEMAGVNGGALAMFYGHSRNAGSPVVCRVSASPDGVVCRHSIAAAVTTCRTTQTA